jgi:hypothetical protein
MVLDGVNPYIFGMFANWLYTQKIESSSTGGQIQTLNLRQLAMLWLLAQRFQIPELQDQTMESILLQKAVAVDLRNFLHTVYNGGEGEPTRELLKKVAIDKTLLWFSLDKWAWLVNNMPAAMEPDLMRELMIRHAGIPQEERGLLKPLSEYLIRTQNTKGK